MFSDFIRKRNSPIKENRNICSNKGAHSQSLDQEMSNLWFGMVWYGLIGGECMKTSEFINKEISMLFCSKKFAGWWVGGMK